MHIASDLKQQFGYAVRLRRNDLGVSQEVLAERAGLHRTYIADIERGARNPSLAAIDRLAAALDTSIGALFTLNGTKSERVEILLVEDDPRDVRLTLRAFKRAGLRNHVQVVSDGQAALEYLLPEGGEKPGAAEKDRGPSLVLLDLGLPKIDGIEVLRRLKSDDRTRAMPVVVLTASNADRHIEVCRELGVQNYIIKPVDFQRLCQVTPQLHLSWLLLQNRPLDR